MGASTCRCQAAGDQTVTKLSGPAEPNPRKAYGRRESGPKRRRWEGR
ncbi:hypothetical protein N177_0499 [Lutibaculum baratangense AMV1]|uniref:Uncharacterized protein n=1 Tax=Lutibaculum baratangense AMV1 TaxID=631454 RepID=V4RUG0_9HYPH|nr:hypothetical protein N177_0499 [Lutibaculum baratangense AMV1]